MINVHQLYKLTNHLVIVIIFITFSTLHAKNLDKFEKAESISDYFSGIVSLTRTSMKIHIIFEETRRSREKSLNLFFKIFILISKFRKFEASV